ncbi:hypothetical protein [Haloferula sp. BvORR071]|uniref:hypothetical protein n=1 Tax=Haloferula sp. BvORR071 TaxID=1396141 RepID=UPI002240F755|nr:hypothetical protein [Haloferula sp. BvORR071]
MSIAENEKDPVIEGTIGGVILGIVILLMLDVISLVVGLIGAGILRLFKLHFGRSLALVSSIFLSLLALLMLIGFLLPEELEVNGESALPKVEAVE